MVQLVKDGTARRIVVTIKEHIHGGCASRGAAVFAAEWWGVIPQTVTAA